MPRHPGIFEIDPYPLSLTQPESNTFVDDRAVAHPPLQSLAKRVRRSQDVIKQSSHTKIEFLSEVKPETIVLERCCSQLKKPDMTFDGETGARIIDLLTRQTGFPQQRFYFNTLLFRTPTGKPSEDSHGTRKSVEVFAVGIAHTLRSRRSSTTYRNKSLAHCNKFHS